MLCRAQELGPDEVRFECRFIMHVQVHHNDLRLQFSSHLESLRKALGLPEKLYSPCSCRRRPIIRSIKSEPSASRTEQRVASVPRWESSLILEGKNGSTQSVFCPSNWEHPIGHGRSVRFGCAG